MKRQEVKRRYPNDIIFSFFIKRSDMKDLRIAKKCYYDENGLRLEFDMLLYNIEEDYIEYFDNYVKVNFIKNDIIKID
jgi:capsule polysaccharide export protein KpsE/RkpR